MSRPGNPRATRPSAVLPRAGRTAAILLALAGCAQDMFKATPFARGEPPYMGGEYPETKGPAEDRVNLWPFFYHRAPATSFLWPFGEKTDTTWALRPFVASYDGNLDLLWPLIHLDKDGSGYALPFVWHQDFFAVIPIVPVFVHEREEWMALPFFTLNSRADHGWFGTLPYVRIWNQGCRITVVPPLLSGGYSDAADGSGGFFTPLGYRFRNGKDRATGIPPLLAFWGSGSNDYFLSLPYMRFGARDERFGVLPPLLTGWFSKASDSSGGFLSPAVCRSWKGERRDTFVPFLLTGWGKSPEEKSGHAFSPLFYRGWKPGQETAIIPPLLAAAAWNPEGKSGWLASPACVRAWDAKASTTVLPPLLSAWGSEQGSDSWFATPLLGMRKSPDGTRATFLIPFLTRWRSFGKDSENAGGWDVDALLGAIGLARGPKESSERLWPLYSRSATPDASSLEFLASAVAWKKTRDGASSRILPFYYRSGNDQSGLFGLPFLLYFSDWDKDRSNRLVLPLLWRLSSGGSETTVVPPLLSGWSRDADGNGSTHLLASAVAWGKSQDGDFSRVLPLYYRSRRGSGGSFGLPLLLTSTEWSASGGSGSCFPLLASWEWTPKKTSFRIPILFYHDFDADYPRYEKDKKRSVEHSEIHSCLLFHRTVERDPAAAGDGVSMSETLFPLYSRGRDGTASSFRLLFGLLYDHDENSPGKGEGYRRSRVLLRLWHDESQGDRRALDVFPFFTYDRRGTETKTVSWLYTFFRYERKGAAKRLNLFFLPAIRWGGGGGEPGDPKRGE